MNRQSSPRPTGRTSTQSLTIQQIIVLILFAIFGIATLTLAAFMLLANHPSGAREGAGLLATWTPQTGNAAPATSTQNAGQPLPALPAGCSQASGVDSQAVVASQGTVTRVVDGDTLEVQVNGQTLRVGYAGIEVPAGSEPARQKAQELLAGQSVVLVKDVSEQDSAGRLVRYVLAGERFINFELVRQGLAVAQPDSPDRACASFLQQAQQQARVERLGLWNPTPVPTKTFMPFVTLDPSKGSGCDCSKKYVCSDFKTHAEAQACFNVCNDYSSKLDDDRDGIACENLP